MDSMIHKRDYLTLSLDQIDYISIDIETTGLHASEGHKICEIAAVYFNPKRKSEEPCGSLWSLINPLRIIPVEATQKHGLTNELVQGAPTFNEFIPALLSYLKDYLLVAYNSDFDMYFINFELQQNKNEPLSNPIIDVYKVAKRFLNLNRYNLESVAAAMNINYPLGLKPHSALGDAIVNGKLFYKLINKAIQIGYTYVLDLLKLIGDKKQELQEMIMKITDAIFKEKKMKIKYHSLQNEIAERTVLPKKLEERNQEYFLVAFCYLKQQERTFALNRILYWEVLD